MHEQAAVRSAIDLELAAISEAFEVTEPPSTGAGWSNCRRGSSDEAA
jgi:hypothetical protein